MASRLQAERPDFNSRQV